MTYTYYRQCSKSAATCSAPCNPNSPRGASLQVTVGEVARRLVKVRSNFDALRREADALQQERQQCTEQLGSELRAFGELCDRLDATVGTVPEAVQEVQQ